MLTLDRHVRVDITERTLGCHQREADIKVESYRCSVLIRVDNQDREGRVVFSHTSCDRSPKGEVELKAAFVTAIRTVNDWANLHRCHSPRLTRGLLQMIKTSIRMRVGDLADLLEMSSDLMAEPEEGEPVSKPPEIQW